eukprot:EG_transcript_7377
MRSGASAVASAWLALGCCVLFLLGGGSLAQGSLWTTPVARWPAVTVRPIGAVGERLGRPLVRQPSGAAAAPPDRARASAGRSPPAAPTAVLRTAVLLIAGLLSAVAVVLLGPGGRRSPSGGQSFALMAVSGGSKGNPPQPTVVISRCSDFVTEEDLQQQFPAAAAVRVERLGGAQGARAVLRFRTAEEAQAVVETPGLQVNGQPVVARIQAASVNNANAEMATRTVILLGCPLTATNDDLRQLLPLAEDIRPVVVAREFTGKCFAVLPTREEAEAVTKAGGLRLRGQPVRAVMAAERMTKGMEANRTVVLDGCPESTKATQLQDQFPGVEAVRLLPRWPSGPFSGVAFLVFPTPEAAAAVAQAPVPQVNGAPVTASLSGDQRWLQAQRPRQVFLSGCPVATTPAELAERFPTAEFIRPLPIGGPFSGRCFIVFRTAEEAQAMASTVGLEVNGKPVKARMGTDGEAILREEIARTVRLSDCPKSITAAALQEQFPTVEGVLLGTLKGNRASLRAFLVFPTAAEAAAVANTVGLQVGGQPVRAAMTGPTWKTKNKRSKKREAPQEARTR